MCCMPTKRRLHNSVLENEKPRKLAFGPIEAAIREQVRRLSCLMNGLAAAASMHTADQSSIAVAASKWTAGLYTYEKTGNDLDAAARKRLPAQEAGPILKFFETWWTKIRPTVAPGSGTAKLLDCIMWRSPALTRRAWLKRSLG